ncbi:hypothetical protein GGTG_10359 [Gaeumannomyces tritici R3-111a-1]|uniref:Uncharacterized protein n=1 Tax=Gaeumannomyces tritici (strain R3-111a-1) TaxID=644352 RepID=J3PA36_GAET3|nr:hypothetical protein GGTG_10359 [Gaeumannomyces tritici R3-111a-1]EJT73522.1 hypothetical protein GGTG_10359 [Gaeumannomyces tritici R3-111a-1]
MSGSIESGGQQLEERRQGPDASQPVVVAASHHAGGGADVPSDGVAAQARVAGFVSRLPRDCIPDPEPLVQTACPPDTKPPPAPTWTGKCVGGGGGGVCRPPAEAAWWGGPLKVRWNIR